MVSPAKTEPAISIPLNKVSPSKGFQSSSPLNAARSQRRRLQVKDGYQVECEDIPDLPNRLNRLTNEAGENSTKGISAPDWKVAQDHSLKILLGDRLSAQGIHLLKTLVRSQVGYFHMGNDESESITIERTEKLPGNRGWRVLLTYNYDPKDDDWQDSTEYRYVEADFSPNFDLILNACWGVCQYSAFMGPEVTRFDCKHFSAN